MWDEIDEYIKNNYKIQAVKKFKKLFDCSLSEAKDVIDVRQVYIKNKCGVLHGKDGEIWIHRDFFGNDEIHVIRGEVIINHVTGNEKVIRMGEMLISDNYGINTPKAITKDMLPL